MEYRRLGSSGLRVSAIGLGSWVTYGKQVGAEPAQGCISAAYDAGVNLFDTAEGYADGRAEEILGDVFRDRGWARGTLVISTKVFFGGDAPNQSGLSRKHITEACHTSLKRLGVDHIDLYFCHRPDPHTPVEETVRAMDTLVRQGKVLYWGTSYWDADRVTEALEIARAHHLTPPTMEQPPYNMFQRARVERELAPLCAGGLGLTTFSPLFEGVLSGKYRDGVPADSRAAFRGPGWVRHFLEGDKGTARRRAVYALCGLARDLSTTPAALAIAWCLKNPHVGGVITGARTPAQVRANLDAVPLQERLDDAVMEAIRGILAPLDTAAE